jgi:hypothetical protein
MALGLGKTSAIFGTGIGLLDILQSRGRGSNLPDDFSPTTPGSQELTTNQLGHPHLGKDPRLSTGKQGSRDGLKSKFSIQKLSSELNDLKGLYQANRYDVTIHVNKQFPDKYKDYGQKLRFMCNSAALPGVQILASDHRRQGFGTFDRRVFGAQITDIPLTFMLDNKGYVLSFFQDWFNRIVYYHPETEHSAQKGTGAQKFEVNYRDNYECQIEISTYDQLSNNIITYKLFEAFPFQMGDVTVAWAETDAFSLLPVQFTFRNYTTSRQLVDNSISMRATEEKQYFGGYPGFGFAPKPGPAPVKVAKATFDYPAYKSGGLAGQNQDPGPYENPSMAGFGKHGR